jgi:hypothetical protein
LTVAIARPVAARSLQEASPIIQRCPLMSIDPCLMIPRWQFSSQEDVGVTGLLQGRDCLPQI